MKRFWIFAAALAVAVVMALPASAITDGELDGDGHPAVVLLLMDVGGAPTFRCSATLLSATVVLTAGHCTSNFPDSPYTGMRVFVESDVDNGTNNYPNAGPNTYEAASWAAHPDFETAPFFVHDVGVVVLADAGVPTSVIPASAYATLPSANQLDVLKTRRGKQNVTFTAVGYGLQQINPVFIQADRVRMVAHPRLIQINTPGFTGDFSLLLSNNHSTGGTCFGDSGGPNFLADSNVVAGVTSFGLNGNCAGTGGVFRMDRQNVLDFVNPYLLLPNAITDAKLRKGAVTNVKLRGDAVTGGKVKDRSLNATDFALDQLPAGAAGAKGDKDDTGITAVVVRRSAELTTAGPGTGGRRAAQQLDIPAPPLTLRE